MITQLARRLATEQTQRSNSFGVHRQRGIVVNSQLLSALRARDMLPRTTPWGTLELPMTFLQLSERAHGSSGISMTAHAVSYMS